MPPSDAEIGVRSIKSVPSSERPSPKRSITSSKTTDGKPRPGGSGKGSKTPRNRSKTPDKTSEKHKRSSSSSKSSDRASRKSQHRSGSRSRSTSRQPSTSTDTAKRERRGQASVGDEAGRSMEVEGEGKSKGKVKERQVSEESKAAKPLMKRHEDTKDHPERARKGKITSGSEERVSGRKEPEEEVEERGATPSPTSEHLQHALLRDDPLQPLGNANPRPHSRRGDRDQPPSPSPQGDNEAAPRGQIYDTLNDALHPAAGAENTGILVQPVLADLPAQRDLIDPALAEPPFVDQLRQASQQHRVDLRRRQARPHRPDRLQTISASKSGTSSEHQSSRERQVEPHQPLFAQPDSSSGYQDVTEGVLQNGGLTQDNTSNGVTNTRSGDRSHVSDTDIDRTRGSRTGSSSVRHRHSTSSRSRSRLEGTFILISGLKFKYGKPPSRLDLCRQILKSIR